jgi:hypothetical protein
MLAMVWTMWMIGQAPAVAPTPCKIVVLNLQARNMPGDDELPKLLTETVAAEVAAVSGCQVVSQADLSSMLDLEAAKAACGAESESCLAEIGSAMGADKVIGGTIGALGSDTVITTRLMDVKQAVVLARGEVAVRGETQRLRVGAKNAARQLFGQQALPYPDEMGPPIGAIVLMGVGALVAAGGGGALAYAELALGDPITNTATKDTSVVVGYAGVAGLALGATLVAVGGVWWALPE